MEVLFIYLGYAAMAVGVGLMFWFIDNGPQKIISQRIKLKEAERAIEEAKLARARLEQHG